VSSRHRAPTRTPAPAVVTAIALALVLALAGITGAVALGSSEDTSAAAPASVQGESLAAAPVPSASPSTVSPSAVPSREPTTAASPTPTPTVAGTVPGKRPTIAQLRAEQERIDKELEARTVEYKAAVDELTASKDELADVETRATAARTAAVAAQTELGKYAAAAYRGQQFPMELVVLLAPPGETTDTLHNLQKLEFTGEVKTDIANFAEEARLLAETLEADAIERRNTIAVQTWQLAELRAQAFADVVVVEQRLVEEAERIARVQARRAAKSCLQKAEVAKTYPNGLIPAELLCGIDIGSYVLRGDAAVAFKKLAVAYEKDFDREICVTSAYRDRALQASLFANDPVMVAPPGRSQHGMGLAVDLCGGIENFGSKQHEWMQENGPRFGWTHPSWAAIDGSLPEPWHWEFGQPDPDSDPVAPAGPTPSDDVAQGDGTTPADAAKKSDAKKDSTKKTDGTKKRSDESTAGRKNDES
jgi:hypothetical protein